jgi:hypothetical protein
MKKTIITVDIDDIFLITEGKDKLLSTCNVSVCVNKEGSKFDLPSSLRKRLVEHRYKIRTDGTVIAHIIHPSNFQIGMADITRILDVIKEQHSGNLFWGVASDDMTNNVTIGLIFEV